MCSHCNNQYINVMSYTTPTLQINLLKLWTKSLSSFHTSFISSVWFDGFLWPLSFNIFLDNTPSFFSNAFITSNLWHLTIFNSFHFFISIGSVQAQSGSNCRWCQKTLYIFKKKCKGIISQQFSHPINIQHRCLFSQPMFLLEGVKLWCTYFYLLLRRKGFFSITMDMVFQGQLQMVRSGSSIRYKLIFISLSLFQMSLSLFNFHFLNFLFHNLSLFLHIYINHNLSMCPFFSFNLLHNILSCHKFYFLQLFFKSYTQYIPLSIYDLQTWMGSPSIYVYDCSNAG